MNRTAAGILVAAIAPYAGDSAGMTAAQSDHKVLDLALERGYGSDLAQYYKKVKSWGVQVEIGSF
jgi:hypothetical protein